MPTPSLRNSYLAHQPWLWAGLLLFLLIATRLITGFDGLYGQDPYAYYNFARDIQSHWLEGTTLPGFNWPRLYPFLGALWLWGDPGPWMQFISMLGMALTLAMVIRMVNDRMPGHAWTSPLLFLFIGLAPFAFRNALCILSDTPALGFATVAMWQGQRYLTTHAPRRLLLAALFTSLAVWMRYPIALVMFPPWLAWAWHAIRQQHWAWAASVPPLLLLGAVPQLFLLPHPPTEGLTHALQNSQVQQWSTTYFLQREFHALEGRQQFLAPNLLANIGMFWHPRFLGLGILGTIAIVFGRRLYLPRPRWHDLAAIAINALFLSGVPFQNARFLLPALPATAQVLGPAWIRLANLAAKRKALLIAALFFIGLAQLSLGIYACRVVIAGSRQDQDIADELAKVPDHGQRLYEFGLEAMLPARHIPFKDANMWYPDLPAPHPGDMIAFNLPAVSAQFQGLPPMQNWERLSTQHTLKTLATWPGGWTLYEIQ